MSLNSWSAPLLAGSRCATASSASAMRPGRCCPRRAAWARPPSPRPTAAAGVDDAPVAAVGVGA
eukprot:1564477-Pyramimonas_sp.AAC.1